MTELVVFDLDGTLIEGQSQEGLIKFLYKIGYIPFGTYLNLALWFVFYKLHIINNPRTALVSALKFLKGKNPQEFNSMVKKYFEDVLKHKFLKECVSELREHQQRGRDVIIVSNAIEPIVKLVAEHLNVKEYICTMLEVKNGRYTGRPEGEIVYGPNKADFIQNFIDVHFPGLKASWGYGDHVSDVPFLDQVLHPVAVNPSPKLASIAHSKAWSIKTFK